jgi:hypothetical protein
MPMTGPDWQTLGGVLLIAIAVAVAIIRLRNGSDNTRGADGADAIAGQPAGWSPPDDSAQAAPPG